MRWPKLLTVVFAATVFLAGCTSGETGLPQNADTIVPDENPKAEAGVDTGGLEGTVLNDETFPIGGADVYLTPDIATVTDKAGFFSFSGVVPGSYDLFVLKAGYEQASRKVTVEAGQIGSVSIQLVGIPTGEPRRETIIWRGNMACSAAIQGVGWSEECAEGVGTPLGTYGANEDNIIDYDFDMLEQPATFLGESVWTPASSLAGKMRVIVVSNLVCDPFCGQDASYGDARGGPPVRNLIKGSTFPDDDQAYPLNMTMRHWADFDGDNPIVVIYEQPFEVFKTEFYNQEIPSEEWSAIPEGYEP